ncbi:MAG TPA: ATP-binding protein [Ideonella sp.]|uniref:sensor histidine kinase n=1 Tax=Ideonella sp. TaxID=1929293 RepID=UPI002C93002E|nr:ATP-binding protein [Ideonella sp.]HSI50706.1 ATP-binding protein [Ideonella sp.]
MSSALPGSPALAWSAATGLAVLGLALAWHSRRRRRRRQARREDRLRERDRVAVALYDDLLQSTQGLVLNLQVIASRLPPAEAPRQQLEALLDDADAIIAGARDRLPELGDLGADEPDLVQALVRLGADLALRHGVQFSFHGDAQLPPLRPAIRREVFYIAREALANACRHAHAGRVALEVHHQRQSLAFVVRDDGRGIDVQALAGPPRPGHCGIMRMTERAVRIGGSLHIGRREAGGTEVRLQLRPQRLFRRTLPRWLAAPLQRLHKLLDVHRASNPEKDNR